MSIFNQVKGLRPKKNAFNKSYTNRFTTTFGKLVPCYIEHAVPGSSFSLNTGALARFLALNAPIMDNINMYVHFWKIPYRLLDIDWTKFIGGEFDNDSDYDPAFISNDPTDFGSFYDYLELHFTENFAKCVVSRGELMDMLGYNPVLLFDDEHQFKLNIRPLQSYALVLKHWYINEHIKLPVDNFDFLARIDDLLNVTGEANHEISYFLHGLYELSNNKTTFFLHAWSKNYFTAALPNVQQGEPVTLSFTGNAPVSVSNPVNIENNFVQNGSAVVSNKNLAANMSGFEDASWNILKDGSNIIGEADLSEASAITINELRVANALQVFKERLMRFGHRYVEYQKGFFNVTPSDARLQLPEWLGGGKFPINISEIAQMSQSTAESPQGNLAGKGTGFATQFAGFKHAYCEEECIIIGLCYLQPKQSFCQGINRMLMKLNDRYDYFNPSFEHLGEQEVWSRELYANAPADKVFGYLPRYSEYRVHLDETHGEFANFDAGGLGYWTLTRAFVGVPELNKDFIYTQPSSLQRIFAVEDQMNNVLVDFFFNVKMVAPISRFGTPMLLG